MFLQKRNSNYKKFKEQIRSLDDNRIQKIMLQIMFLYSDNYFYSKGMESLLNRDPIIKRLSETTTIIENPKIKKSRELCQPGYSIRGIFIKKLYIYDKLSFRINHKNYPNNDTI